ncbi:MAG: hypothetical protein CM1200mP2_14450 [Planctomycetaceae bacterium]|nr:MAG: hypothetical protein CM1200mP2_14450 [Planctomycetaceae bacterium]
MMEPPNGQLAREVVQTGPGDHRDHNGRSTVSTRSKPTWPIATSRSPYFTTRGGLSATGTGQGLSVGLSDRQGGHGDLGRASDRSECQAVDLSRRRWREMGGCHLPVGVSAGELPGCGSLTPRPPGAAGSCLPVRCTLSCVTTTTVGPVPHGARGGNPLPLHRSCGRVPVGSSASPNLGCFNSARAMATRCCSPPESSPGDDAAVTESDLLDR